MTDKGISILIADDHPLSRIGVKETLSKLETSEIYEAEEGKEALGKILDLEPDIALIDLRMPGKTGLEILAELYDTDIPTRIILLTMFKNINYFYQAVALGAKGYLLKETAVKELINAIKTVQSGQTFISERLQNLINAEPIDEDEKRLLIASVNSLTENERNIMQLLSQWKTNHEIAEIMFNSVRTIENRRAAISDKLNLRGKHNLIKFAIENRELF
jgi:DNA-binding NarL/FixJ family response regulator